MGKNDFMTVKVTFDFSVETDFRFLYFCFFFAFFEECFCIFTYAFEKISTAAAGMRMNSTNKHYYVYIRIKCIIFKNDP